MPFRHFAISLFHHFTIWLRRTTLRSGSPFRHFAISLFTFVLFIASSCNHHKQDRIYIAGEIEGVSGMIFLQEQKTFELLKIDSMVPDVKGKFFWHPKTDETSIYSVWVTPDDKIVFIAKPGDSILISGTLNQYPSLFQVSGNKESDLINSFYTYSAGNIREVDSLQVLVGMNQGEDDFYELTVKVDSLFNQIWERQRSYEKNFIREHAGNFSTLLIVNYHFGVRPVLSPKADAEDYRRVDSGLMANYPDNRHTLFFHQWLKEVK